MFWYMLANLFAGATIACVVSRNAQRLAFISTIPTAIALIFEDAMPRKLHQGIWFQNMLATLIALAGIYSLSTLPKEQKLEFSLKPLINQGTTTWAGLAINFSANYIILVMKNLILALYDSSSFVILKARLQSKKVMENRANMIISTAKQDKLFEEIGENAQKLVTAIVGSQSESLPWEIIHKSDTVLGYMRYRIDESHAMTRDSEFKSEVYLEANLKALYKTFFDHEVWTVVGEEMDEKYMKFFNSPLPRMQILCRRFQCPPGVSDRWSCVQTNFGFFPEHGLAFTVSQDADDKYLKNVPDKIKGGGAIRLHLRLGGYCIESISDQEPLTKVTYFSSGDIGGWVPSWIRTMLAQQELIRVSVFFFLRIQFANTSHTQFCFLN
eukprot:g3702.t1